MKSTKKDGMITLEGTNGDDQETLILFRVSDFNGLSYTNYNHKGLENFLSVNIQGVSNYIRCTDNELNRLNFLLTED